MISVLLEQIKQSPLFPEIMQEGLDALRRERELRAKFYQDISPELKWEFINGEVVMHSHALNRHLLATQRIYDLMRPYTRQHGLGELRIEKALVCFPRNDYEPDIVFYGVAKAAQLTPDTLRFPIPDLIVEVLSPSTETTDRTTKFHDYAAHGVREYWIIDPAAETVELYRLASDIYPETARQAEGTLRSEVIQGFEIPLRALFDEAANLEALRTLLA